MRNIRNKKIIIFITIFFFSLIIFLRATSSYAATITTYNLSDVESNWDKQNMESQRIEIIEKGARKNEKTSLYSFNNNPTCSAISSSLIFLPIARTPAYL